MEKASGNLCPRCNRATLNVYYEEDSDLKIAAVCENCNIRGYFVGAKLVPMLYAR